MTKIKGVTVFVLLTSEGFLYFVKMSLLNVNESEKFKVSKIFWKWNRIDLAGFKVYRREGTFSLPTANGKILSAECVLYILPVLARHYVLGYPDFSRENLLFLIDTISET